MNTTYSYFNIILNKENTLAVTLVAMYDSNADYTTFDITIAEGESPFDEEVLKQALVDFYNTSDIEDGVVELEIDGKKYFVEVDIAYHYVKDTDS